MKSERASDSWLFGSTHHLGSVVGGVSCCLALFCHNTMNSGLDIVRLFWLDGCLMIGEDDCRLHHTSERLQSHFHHGVDNVAISAGRPIIQHGHHIENLPTPHPFNAPNLHKA